MTTKPSVQDHPPGDPSAEPQSTIYCVIPPELSTLWEPLARHFSDDPGVEVVLERRRVDRRSGRDRRKGAVGALDEVERRFASGLEGRRFGERRARVLSVQEQPALPTDLYAYSEQLRFLRRREASGLPMDVARWGELAAAWRERCRDAEREATELLQTLVGVADDLGRVRSWSPRRFLAVRRAQQAIERYRRRRAGDSNPPRRR